MNKKKFFSIVILLVIGISFYIYAIPKIKGNYSGVNHSNFRCGKIETPDGDYTIKIPKKYAYFPFSYSGESIWDPSTQVKKENPCLFPIGSASFDYIWPSLSPYGKIPHQVHNPNLVTVSIRSHKLMDKKETDEEFKNSQIDLFENQFVINMQIYEGKNYDFTEFDQLISEGVYDHDLKLYRKERILSKVHRVTKSLVYQKTENFWKLDEKNNVFILITCDYKGYKPLEIPFSDAMCIQKKRSRKYDSTITMQYLGRFINEWEKIEAETDKFLNEFITKEEK